MGRGSTIADVMSLSGPKVRSWVRRRLAAVCLVGVVTAAGGVLGAGAASATPGNVGGLALADYCKSLGDHGTTAMGPAILRLHRVTGPNFAYQNWACVRDSGTVVPIRDTGPAPSMLDACLVQHPNLALYAAPIDPNDAFTWNCFLLPPAASSSVADEDRAAVTALMQTDVVQAEIVTLQAEVAAGHSSQALLDGVRFLHSRAVGELIADVLGGYHLSGQQGIVTAGLGAAMTRAVLNQP